MRSKIFTELRVGLFVFITLLLGMITLFQLGSGYKLFRKDYSLYTNFEDISGLRPGAPVQLAGLDVGIVDSIRFPKDLLVKKITLVLRINQSYQDRIRADSVATINTQGLLGDKYVYISVGNQDQPILKNNEKLLSRETASLFSLADKAGTIMDNISEASETINDLFKSIGGKDENNLRDAIKSLRNTLNQIEKGQGLVHALIFDPKGEKVVGDLAATLDSLKEITTGISDDSKKQTSGLIKNLRTASADLKDILGSIRRGEGTLGLLVRDPALYNDLRALFGRANRNALIKSVVRSTLKKNEAQTLTQ
ncbi:MAG: MlaD family protein [Pseudomonadota bacterium]